MHTKRTAISLRKSLRWNITLTSFLPPFNLICIHILLQSKARTSWPDKRRHSIAGNVSGTTSLSAKWTNTNKNKQKTKPNQTPCCSLKTNSGWANCLSWSVYLLLSITKFILKAFSFSPEHTHNLRGRGETQTTQHHRSREVILSQ